MAIDGYMYFQYYDPPPQDGKFLLSESQVDASQNKENLFADWGFKDAASSKALFEIEDFSFDIEQVLNIGSQSTGAGAGRVTFNPFSITRKIDKASPVLFEMACSGTPFKQVALGLRKGSGGGMSGQMYLVFFFKLVAVKTISWSYDDESPKETTTFEYGGLQIHYTPQKPDGQPDKEAKGGWNRVKNIKDQQMKPEIA
jgi:type VI secretion system secreted protein Hcp